MKIICFLNLNSLTIVLFLCFLNNFIVCKSDIFQEYNQASNKHFIETNNYLNNDLTQTSYQNVKLKDVENKNSILLDQNVKFLLNEFKLKKKYDNLTFVYGLHPTLWLLGKFNDKLTGYQTIDLLVSRNNGKSFSLKKKDFLNGGAVESIYTNEFYPENVILNDPKNKCLYKSSDNGFEFHKIALSFRPDLIFFTKDQNIVYAIEDNGKTKNFWVSFDFAENWTLIGKNLKKIPKW